jgi:hypothetical protein
MAEHRPEKSLLIEAESFSDFGGWVLDQQFMAEMGSPYLLAHGLGRPVQDAVTTIELPAPGSYRLWVRTKDWVAIWNAEGAPGKFQLLVDGIAVPTLFGTQGAQWHWQDGGVVKVDRRRVELALHDLTGFEGRCDAILLCADTDFVPPNEPASLESFRNEMRGGSREPADGGAFDLVVVGGGIAGMCAALSAARLGLTVAFLQDRPVLGGNNSSEVRVHLSGETRIAPYPHIGETVDALVQKKWTANSDSTSHTEAWEDEQRLAAIRSEKNISLLLDCHVIRARTDGSTVASIVAQNIRSGRRMNVRGRLFADCTGDGELGFLAGADCDVTRRGHMGPSNIWRVVDTGTAAPFARCPWALDLTDKPFPGRGTHTAQWATPGLKSLGMWFWESGLAWDPLTETELMRDWNFRAMYGAWDTLKNVDGLYPNHRLLWAAYIAGKRESRRLLGDVILTQEDIVSGHEFADGCFPCTWALDLHRPHEDYQAGFEGREFITYSYNPADFKKPYWAPYRCLYSRNIKNLFMAGRDISVTHEALGTVRVMGTTGMMGEIVGMAAQLCRQHDCTPRDVYSIHLEQFKDLLKKGVPLR